MTKSRAVLVVEDDRFFMEDICTGLHDRGLVTIEVNNERQALEALEANASGISVALLDIRFDADDATTTQELDRGNNAGLRLARTIRQKYPRIRLIGMSLGAEERVRNWFIEYGFAFLEKVWLNGGADRQFFDVVERAARQRQLRRTPNVFIVHGKDEGALHGLVDFLCRGLHWKDPKILRELPSCGRTIIEKFEDAVRNVDIAFVLLTPDDVTVSADASNLVKRRARQNVIFELGYFFAKLQRIGGRVILLHKGDIEIPSDISGIAYVDISSGIDAAKETIRREVSVWL